MRARFGRPIWARSIWEPLSRFDWMKFVGTHQQIFHVAGEHFDPDERPGCHRDVARRDRHPFDAADRPLVSACWKGPRPRTWRDVFDLHTCGHLTCSRCRRWAALTTMAWPDQPLAVAAPTEWMAGPTPSRGRDDADTGTLAAPSYRADEIGHVWAWNTFPRAPNSGRSAASNGCRRRRQAAVKPGRLQDQMFACSWKILLVASIAVSTGARTPVSGLIRSKTKHARKFRLVRSLTDSTISSVGLGDLTPLNNV